MKSLLFRCSIFFLFSISCQLAYAAEKTLVFSMQTLPTNRSVNGVLFESDHILLRNISEGLFTTDVKGRVIPGQAERYEVSKDGLEYKFYLRDNIYWSNGNKVVAQDYVRAWQRLVDPQYEETSNKTQLKALVNYEDVVSGRRPPKDIGVASTGEKILSVKLNKPLSFFVKLLTIPQLAPVPSSMSDAQLESMLKSDATDLLSNGPFKLVLMTESEVRIQKNPFYWEREAVFFEEVRFLKSKFVKSAVISVVSGKSDIAFLRDRRELQWIKSRYPNYLKDFARYGTEFYSINLGNKMLNENTKLREALSMSVDRDKIVYEILQSGVPAYNLVPNEMYHEKRQTLPEWFKISYPKRLEIAKGIVEEYKAKYQSKPEINLKIKNEPQTHKVAIAVKLMWEGIGFTVNTEEMDVREVYKDIESGDFEMARAAWFADYNDPYSFLYLYGDAGKSLFGPKPLESVESLLKKALSELDSKARESLYVEIEDENHQYNTIIPLYHYEHTYVLNPKLYGIEATQNTGLLKWAYRGL